MTRNTIQRLLVFFVGVPLFIAVELYFSFGRNIALVLLVLGLQVFGINEAAAMFAIKKTHLNKGYVLFLSQAATLLAYFAPVLAGVLPNAPSPLEIVLAAALLGSLAVIAPLAFAKAEDFPDLLSKAAASLFVFFYCGVLSSFLVYITSCFGQMAAPVFTFTLMTFGNDSLAWLVGITLGRKRGIVAVSPGKSMAGFIGGVSGSLAAALLSYSLFPGSGFGSPSRVLFLGLAMACTVILGDLVESALKRSAGVKDSSSLVPGRGGVLDSFDSLLFSAPIFALISSVLGFFPPLA